MGIGDFLGGLGSNKSLNDIFSNPLILQYLSGIGSGLVEGGFKGGVKNAGAITQQNISTQNYMKMLTRMLGGDMSDGGKMTMDKDGMKLSLPPSTSPTQMDSPMPGGSKLNNMEGQFNPFASGQPSFSVSDLAGLNPELISQALQLTMQQEGMKQKSVNDVVNQALNLKQIEYYGSLIEENKAQAEIAKGKNEIEAFKALTKDERTELRKNYEFAKEEGFKGSLVDFKNSGGTPTSYDEYKLAKEEGYKGKFTDFITMKAKAGSTTIQLSPFEQTRQRELAQSQADVMSPSFSSNVTKDLSKSNPEDWAYPAEASSVEDIPRIQQIRTLREMDSRIRQAFSEDKIERKSDGWYRNGKLIVRNPYARR